MNNGPIMCGCFVCFLPTTKTFFPTWGKIKLWNTKFKTPDWHPIPGKQVYLFNGFTNHSWLCNKIVKVETCSNNCTRSLYFFFSFHITLLTPGREIGEKGPNLCWFNWQMKKKKNHEEYCIKSFHNLEYTDFFSF